MKTLKSNNANVCHPFLKITFKLAGSIASTYSFQCYLSVTTRSMCDETYVDDKHQAMGFLRSM